MLPVPEALVTVRKRSTTNVKTVNNVPISNGTIIPPVYIRLNPFLGPSWFGQNQWLESLSMVLKFSAVGAPKRKRQIQYPIMIQTNGASHETELPDFLGCTDDVVLFVAATVAVGLVSAMTQLIF